MGPKYLFNQLNGLISIRLAEHMMRVLGEEHVFLAYSLMFQLMNSIRACGYIIHIG